MAYLDIKKRFVKLTGRFDLVVNTTDYVTAPINGVDDVIHDGQRLLDRMTQHHKEFSWHAKDIVSGDFKLEIPNLLSTKEVWRATGSADSTLLEKKSLGEIRECFSQLASGQTKSTPTCWAMAVSGLSQNQSTLTAVGGASPFTAEFTHDFDDLTFGDHFNTRTVLFYPVSNASMTMKVLGRFFEKKLTADTDINFWSEIEPDMLMKAGQLIIERNLRNREGVADHLSDLRLSSDLLTFDIYEEEVSGVDQMAG